MPLILLKESGFRLNVKDEEIPRYIHIYPLPFYGTQMINTFHSSMISAYHNDKVEEFQPIVKSLREKGTLFRNIQKTGRWN